MLRRREHNQTERRNQSLRRERRSRSIPSSETTEFGTVEQYDRFGSTAGNETLTSTTGVALTGLLIAQGVTIVDIGGLRDAHMFIGMVLIPPVLLKLASTGYRAARYYTGSRTYSASGPPRLPLRLTAPFFVAAMLTVLVTGVLLMAQGNKAGKLLEIHKVSFIVWVVLFAAHLLAYASRAVRLTLTDWHLSRRRAVPGVTIRSMLIVAALGGGAALAVSLLTTVDDWHPTA